MEREKALQLLKKFVQNKNLIKHSLAVEAATKALANEINKRNKNLGQNKNYDEQKWAICGLLHDIDYTKTQNNPEKHSLLGAEILKEHGLDDQIIYSVKAHNYIHGLPLKNKMDIALYSVDPLTGLIVASALIHPGKKLKSIDTKFVLNRFKEKTFAKGANREQIKTCQELGLGIDKFLDIVLKAMQQIDKDLGL